MIARDREFDAICDHKMLWSDVASDRTFSNFNVGIVVPKMDPTIAELLVGNSSAIGKVATAER